MKDQPNAEYDNHTLISKRCMSQGVIYQVIIIKEQYVPRKHSVATSDKATATIVETEQGSTEVNKVIDLTIQDEDKTEEIEIVQVVDKKAISKEEKPKKISIKEEKPISDVKMEEEILTF